MSEKISCMVVDDQRQSKELVEDHIKAIPALELKYATTDPIEALNFLDTEKVDCIFLDIEMPGLSGMDFIEALKARHGNAMPKIILITGYDQYALAGYDHGVFDYLLKPVTFKRFKISIDRLMGSFSKNPPVHDFFFTDVDGAKVKISYNDVVWIEGAGNYISIVTTERKMMSYRSMHDISQILPEDKFIRVHKSFIVSLRHIQAVRGNEVILSMDRKQQNIPIGVTYKEKLLKTLRIIE